MAIDLLANPTATAPTALADYQAILTQLVANGQAFTGRLIVQGSNIKAGTVILIGGVLYKATTDTAITGTASSYVKITPSGATASAAFVANLTGVTWNDAYGGYYDGSGNLHVFDEGLAVSSGVITSPKTLIGFSAGPRKRTFTSSGTFVVPTGVTEVWVTGCAAGGNGGTGETAGSYRGGGGGGRGRTVIRKSIAVTSGASITVTIGAVGANTTFGGLLTLIYGANGDSGASGGAGAHGAGSGGAKDASGSAALDSGGAGGLPSVNGATNDGGGGGGGAMSKLDESVVGSSGGGGSGSNAGSGGAGGICGGGGGGGGAVTVGVGGAGGAGNAYGSGGGGGGAGGSGGGAGGAGGPGIIIVEY